MAWICSSAAARTVQRNESRNCSWNYMGILASTIVAKQRVYGLESTTLLSSVPYSHHFAVCHDDLDILQDG